MESQASDEEAQRTYVYVLVLSRERVMHPCMLL